MEETVNNPSTPPSPLPTPSPVASNNQTNNSTTPLKAPGIYPLLTIPYNEHPNRFLAFPVIGYFIRAILLIPQIFILMFASIGFLIVFLIVPFAILFTGKYPTFAYNFILSYQKVYTKLYVYLFGLTDKYPGFSFDENKLFQLEYAKPATSSRFLAFPILGFIIRFILLIPFFFWINILETGTLIAVICSWFCVLFTGRYPESLYEFVHDFLRLTNSNVIYFAYLSDTYPSFRISMNHKPVKIILLIIGIIFAFFNFFISGAQDMSTLQHSETVSIPQPSSDN